MVIYLITNNLNNKIYIGQTTKSIDKYWGSGKLIKRAIAKHGLLNFTKVIIDRCGSLDELNTKEKYWIAYYRDQGFDLYNIAEGGSSGPLPQEVKDLISKNRTGKGIGRTSGMKGKAARNKGVPMSEAQKELLRAPKTKEHKEALSKAHKGKILSDKHKLSLGKAFSGINNPRCLPIEVELLDGSKVQYNYISEFLVAHQLRWDHFRKLQAGSIIKQFKSVKML